MQTIYTTTQQGKRINAICRSEDTRHGFRHLCELQTEDGYTIAAAKVCYLNRTWEVYCFQTVIHAAIEKARLDCDKATNIKRRKALKRQFDRRACPSYYGARRAK